MVEKMNKNIKSLKNITAKIDLDNPEIFKKTLRESRFYEVLEIQKESLIIKKVGVENVLSLSHEKLNTVSKGNDDWFNFYFDPSEITVEEAKEELKKYAMIKFKNKIEEIDSMSARLKKELFNL